MSKLLNFCHYEKIPQKFTANFKAKVALRAIKEQKSLNELS